jgi:hypothetical protein
MKIKRVAFLFVLLLITHLSPSSIQNNKKIKASFLCCFMGKENQILLQNLASSGVNLAAA